MFVHPVGEFQGRYGTELTACCYDCSICCLGLTNPPFLYIDTVEHVCGRTACCEFTAEAICCPPLANYPLRQKIGGKYNIKGDDDGLCTSVMCLWCAVCLEAREVKRRQALND